MSQINCCSSSPLGEVPEGSPGRVNAEDYRISDEVWDDPATVGCDILYAVGGAYGNPEALRTIHAMAKSEASRPLIVYNGDMHWFDGTVKDFALIEELAAGDMPLSGNVELELAREVDSGVGCGCSYPSSVPHAFVARSNQIHERMKSAICDKVELISPLVDRPAIAIVEVMGQRVALTHGDEQLVAGWGCSYESLSDTVRQREVDDWFGRHDIKVLATTHTCAPAAIALPHGVVINNGAAGLPSYRNRPYGLVTRVAATTRADAIYRASIDGLYVEAVPIRYDVEAFLAWFDAIWPTGSAAEVSYRQRIIDGLDQDPAEALLGGFKVCEHLS